MSTVEIGEISVCHGQHKRGRACPEQVPAQSVYVARVNTSLATFIVLDGLGPRFLDYSVMENGYYGRFLHVTVKMLAAERIPAGSETGD